MIEAIIPVLPVRHLETSLSFYLDKLGFQIEWQGERVASVARDGCQILLSQMHGDKKPSWVWIGLQNEDWFSELPAKGATVVQAPTQQTYAYEMKIEDVDGNVLWLGTAPKKDVSHTAS